ncbi:MAG: universal stress protein [Acidobacteriia bacterium]|nr:universal stress protein [Terriglobia bacterium]
MPAPMASAQVSLKNVLFATDFSRHSSEALPYVVSIARKYGSTVIAAHVHSTSPLGAAPPTVELQALAAQAMKEARASMKALEAPLRGIPHEFIVRDGDIWGELSSIVEKKGIDLIVVGTHGRAGASKLLMGSVAERILRQAPCPVLTVGPNVSGEPGSVADIHTILYPTDFSVESMAAFPYAVSLAQEDHARLYLLHVIPEPVDELQETFLKSRIHALIPPDAKLWCEPKVFLESGDPPQVVLEMAEELAVDLIVLGTKHVSRFAGTRTHLGMATAYKIVRQAICPVLSVRG